VQKMERVLLSLILILAAHTKVPAVNFVYPFRPADLVVLLAALLFMRYSLVPARQGIAVREMTMVFVISFISAIWGVHTLGELRLDSMVENGAQVSYFSTALKKLLLVAISFLGFQFVYKSRALSNTSILFYWHRGLLIAVVLHFLCYVVTGEYLAVRAGVFVEGNHGGSYYLMSFFLMWFAQQKGLKFGGSGMFMAFLGMVLTQSSSAVVLWLALVVACFFLLPARAGNRLRKVQFGIALLILTSGLMFLFGPEIAAKFFEEEMNPASFSRYDRIASAISGLNMFEEHPIFGVGIQGYGFALPQFVDPFIETFFRWDYRRIPNNIYVELLAEQGSIGMLAMILVLYRVCKPLFSRLRQNCILAAGASSIFLSWFAFPTYTVSFQWIGLAILVRLAVKGGVGDGVARAKLRNGSGSLVPVIPKELAS